MRIVHDFPLDTIVEDIFIPLSDGCRLAARIWRPAGAEAAPVPAILEYLPYRKNDMTAERDAQTHSYFAGHGFAGVRVDLRGSGESDGLLTDEYLPRELEDGVEILKWLGNQPWCTGSVGMIGISWGGFNGLQIAELQPPELQGVVTICSTDDRYADDVHHMGGCMLADNLSWASTMFDQNACPPDPAVVGDRWREMWIERLKGSGLWLETWLQHQRRDDYWRHGSVCENFDAIQCPVYAVSGWADGYCNAVFRLLKGLKVPRKGLVGPWAHKYPHLGEPGPAIGFLQECLRFFAQTLKGEETGIWDEPMLRVWMQDSVPPSTRYETRPGRWVGEPSWPSSNIVPRRYRLSYSLDLLPEGGAEEPDPRTLSIQSPLFVGLYAGKWCSYNAPPDLPHDQREEDGGSLVFDTGRLSEAVEICGQPRLTLDLSADKPVAMVAARLIDVGPHDEATRVSYGVLNLTHRDSDEDPTPLAPGQRYRVTINLKHIAQRFEVGHSIRVSVSTVYWPLAWPSPESVRLSVRPAESVLELPERPARPADDAALPAFAAPEAGPPLAITRIHPTREEWTVRRDLARDLSHLEVVNDEGSYRLDDIDLTVTAKVSERYTYADADHTSVQGWCEWERSFQRGGWQVRTVTHTLLTCDTESFRVRATLDAFEGGERVYAQTWDTRIPRDLV